MDVTVVGAGNGGRASAAHLALLGHRVTLADRYAEAIAPIRAERRLTASGAITGTAVLEAVTDDLAAAVVGRSVVLVSVPAFALDWIATAIAPGLEPGQVVILHPGGTVGAFVVRAAWERLGLAAGTILAATDSLAYACRLTAGGDPDIHAVKQRLQLAALPASETAIAVAAMRALYPDVATARDVLAIGLANLNPIIHPPITLLNGSRTDRGDRFDVYGDGVTPAVARWIEDLDRERLALGRAVGLELEPLDAWIQVVYGVRAADTVSTFRRLADEVYRGIRSPDGLDSRYLTEDVPFGLAPLADLGVALGVATPVMRATATVASSVLGLDLASTVDLARLGLDGRTGTEMTAHVA